MILWKGALLPIVAVGLLVTASDAQEHPATSGRSISSLSAVPLKARNGEGITLGSRVVPGKPTLIAIWASWCPPCIAEAPALNAIRKDLGSRYTFIYMNRSDGEPDPQQPPQAIARLLGYGGLSDVDYVVADVAAYQRIVGPDMKDLPQGKIGIPRVYLFDSAGRQVYTAYGFDPAAGSTLEERIKRAMAAK